MPHYEPVGFALDPVSPAFVARLPVLVEESVGRRHLRAWSAAGETELDALPPEALYAMYACAKSWTRGAELDLMVDVGDGPRPVSLWWTPDRRVEVAWGEPAPALVAVEPEALADRFDVVGFLGVAWTGSELAAMATALEQLTPTERVVLRGVVFTRGVRSARSPKRELAFFDPSTEPPRLWFFDLAFSTDRVAFVGPVDRPVAPGSMTALHEIGHVLADAPLRIAYLDYVTAFDVWRADPSAAVLRSVARARYRTYRSLGRSGPIVEAWQAFRDGRIGPSSYGFRDPNESFAEGFALYHLDPAALERALPGAVAWFAAGSHLWEGLSVPAAGE